MISVSHAVLPSVLCKHKHMETTDCPNMASVESSLKRWCKENLYWRLSSRGRFLGPPGETHLLITVITNMSLAESIDMRAKGWAVEVLSNPVRMYGNEDPRTLWAWSDSVFSQAGLRKGGPGRPALMPRYNPFRLLKLLLGKQSTMKMGFSSWMKRSTFGFWIHVHQYDLD